MEFFKIRERHTKNGIEIFPDFIVGHHNDFMVRGHSFYAIFDEATGFWSTDESKVQELVNKELYSYYRKRKDLIQDDIGSVSVLYLSSYNSGAWSKYKRYLKDMYDNYKELDSELTFANDIRKRED